MPTLVEIANIKANIKVLEKARDESRDRPIQELIQRWIAEQKRRLDLGTLKNSSAAPKANREGLSGTETRKKATADT